ncbi:MAG TPA: sigma-70 family RNA polymerase sigma factor [Pyrinomonadaceae bacterium]|jgi:RNA polymerase sigma-70 factor, ECF subfamily|nr:sigma-70 family RNA polymerase sigma factor [Pyrinomonadaceae bacterium]
MFGAAANRGSEHGQEDHWASFDAEVMPHAPSLFRIALWLTRDRTEAEDLVQETLTEALGAFHRFITGTNCHAWLVSILYHRNSKRRRAASRLTLVSDSDERIAETAVFEAPTPQSVTDEDVLAALKRLPRSFQEVVILADIEEMSYKEIASAINVPIGTVMSRISRGRKLLRAELAGYARAHGFLRQRALSMD